LPKLVLIAAL
jgi:hypothetical protein